MCCYPLYKAQLTQYPHFDNNYFVDFVDPSDSAWVNPHRGSIKPYIPKHELTQLFNLSALFDNVSHVFCSDFFRQYYSTVEPIDLCSLSEVSKSCYLATKADLIWNVQLKKLLPNVTPLSKIESLFISRHQFQIIFKRLHDTKKPFRAQLQHNFERINELKSSLLQLEAYLKMLNHSKNSRAYTTAPEHEYLEILVGSDYDGSINSINPTSQQGRCLAAFRYIDQEFNDQNKLKNTILSAECKCCIL